MLRDESLSVGLESLDLLGSGGDKGRQARYEDARTLKLTKPYGALHVAGVGCPSSPNPFPAPPHPPPQSDLDAIRTSGVRVVFLLASCASSHVILSSARRKGMLKGYAWVLLDPNAICSVGKGLGQDQHCRE